MSAGGGGGASGSSDDDGGGVTKSTLSFFRGKAKKEEPIGPPARKLSLIGEEAIEAMEKQQ